MIDFRTIKWLPSPTAKGSYFYPVPKFIGQVLVDGKVVAETGKCGTRQAALNKAIHLGASVQA